jgi:hypothetical protein
MSGDLARVLADAGQQVDLYRHPAATIPTELPTGQLDLFAQI